MKKTGTYLADNPISKKSEDSFERWHFADRIAHTIGQREDTDGLVIGLYGEWGDGKTSTLNLMEQILAKHYENIVVTRFNPWYFQSTPDLITGFFDHLATSIGKAIPTVTDQVLGAVNRFGGILAGVISSTTIGTINIDVKKLQESAKEIKKEPSMDELKKRIETLLKKSSKRIVIFIDDIDRLDKNEIHEIFKLVRLSGSFQNVTYVLAFDEQMVASALGDRYAAREVNSGLKFIEKIIQVPLHLPPAQKEALLEVTFAELNKTLSMNNIELSDRDESAVGYEFQTTFGHVLRTPRQVKRYANAIMFAVPVLKGKVNLADLILIEALRIFYPHLYLLVRDNPSAFLAHGGEHRRDDKDRDRILGKLTDGMVSEAEKVHINHLIGELFPRTDNRGTYGDSWEKTWAREKRICSQAYFVRYFNYAVPDNDISDASYDNFIAHITKAKTQMAINELVKKFIKTHTSHAFIMKLSYIESALPLLTAEKIALGIAVSASLFKDNGEIFFSDLARAVSFVARVHARIVSVADRDEFASKIISVTPLNTFAVESYIFMSSKEDVPEATQLMSIETEKKLQKMLVDRIAEEAKKTPPYNRQTGASRLIWHWKTYGDIKQVKEYFTKRLQKHPDEVVDFLAAFVGTAYSNEGRHKSDLRKSEFSVVTDLVDEGDLMEVIKKSKYHKKIDTKEIYFNRNLSDSQRLVNQFVAIRESFKTVKK